MNEPISKTEMPASLPGKILTWLGLLLAIAGMLAFVALCLKDARSHLSDRGPFFGLIAYVLMPAALVAGLGLAGVGCWLKMRRRRQSSDAPSRGGCGCQDSPSRCHLLGTVAGSVVVMAILGVAASKAVHYSESDPFCGEMCHTSMHPVHHTYTNTAHAKVTCAKCHVAPGVSGFVTAKYYGMFELQQTLQDSFPRPLPAAKHMPPAKDTCALCHQAGKDFGDVEKVYTHYLSDATNTPYTSHMLVKVGGANPVTPADGGTHYQMFIANKIEYYATDELRQEIPWVRQTDLIKGKVMIYTNGAFKGEPPADKIRTLDCNDCHSRVGHPYNPPTDLVDGALAKGLLKASMPSVRSNVVAALSQTHTSAEADLQQIAAYLRRCYPNDTRVDKVIEVTQKLYSANFFPVMKTDWRSQPNNISHITSPGCFRCHDGQHKTADNRTRITQHCIKCHLFIGQGSENMLASLAIRGGGFKHPHPSSKGQENNCFTCHKGGSMPADKLASKAEEGP